MTWLLLAIFLLVLGQLVVLLRGLPRVRPLADIAPAPPGALPTVSIVVSALDEADSIEPALRSLLALEGALEVIAIDDRSTDATGAILDRLATDDARLRVQHVRELPPGWLGKTHALDLGAQLARGEFVLFTDADVHFEPLALRRALAHVQAHRLDHLAVLPQLHVREPLLAALLVAMQALFFLTLPPWKLDRSPRVYVGMGAFNLVRSAAYRRAGGHAALRLEVVDDLQLGKRLKQHGARQDLLLGQGTVALEWYRNTGELVRGLEKNAFAASDYSLAKAALGSLALLLVRVVPLLGLLATQGLAWWCSLGATAAALAIHLRVLRGTDWPRRCLAWWPLVPLVLQAVLWRAVVLALWRGGIVWRGTRYPLQQLRRARHAQPH